MLRGRLPGVYAVFVVVTGAQLALLSAVTGTHASRGGILFMLALVGGLGYYGSRLAGEIPTVRIGPREFRYRREDIDIWIARRTSSRPRGTQS